MKLSRHFSLAEMLHSQTAARFDIPMDPPPEVLKNLKRLATRVLEPIRVRAKVPIVVTSGYRPLALNTLVGGAKNSDHIKGLAADIHAVGMPLDKLGAVIRSVSKDIPLRQAIYEFSSWIHVSVLADEDDRRDPEFLIARRDNRKTVYESWRA